MIDGIFLMCDLYFLRLLFLIAFLISNHILCSHFFNIFYARCMLVLFYIILMTTFFVQVVCLMLSLPSLIIIHVWFCSWHLLITFHFGLNQFLFVTSVPDCDTFPISLLVLRWLQVGKAFMVFWSHPWTKEIFAKYMMVDGDKLTLLVSILYVYFCDNMCILLFVCTQ